MSDPRRELERTLLDLAWGQWTALGVSGWRVAGGSAETDAAVDPEALVLLTAALASVDPRLRDEATDWCVTFGRYLSKARLKNLLRLGIDDDAAFHSFAATVNAQARLGWPDDEVSARPFKPTRRSELAVRDRPAAIRLRARLIFGVSARAEILVLLASDPGANVPASELAERIGYGRRNVVEALDALVTAGLVTEVDAPGSRRYALADTITLRTMLDPVPGRFTDWARAFKACWIALRTLRDFAGSSPTVRTVQAAKAGETIQLEVVRSWLVPPRSAPTGSDAWERLGPWAQDFLEALRGPPRSDRPARRARPRASRAKAS